MCVVVVGLGSTRKGGASGKAFCAWSLWDILCTALRKNKSTEVEQKYLDYQTLFTSP